jgi:hypothetical protein
VKSREWLAQVDGQTPNNALVLTLPSSGQGSDVGGLRSGTCAEAPLRRGAMCLIAASVACPGNAAQRQPLGSHGTDPRVFMTTGFAVLSGSRLLAALLQLAALSMAGCGARPQASLPIDAAAAADRPSCPSGTMRCAASIISLCENDQPVLDCDTLNYGDIRFRCTECQARMPACEADRPEISGTLATLVTRSFVYRSGCSPEVTTYADFYAADFAQFLHHTKWNDGVEIIVTTWKSIPSGVQSKLFSDTGWPTALQSPWTVTYSDGHITCRNFADNSPGPPNDGTGTLTHSGAAKGATFELQLDGYLTCDDLSLPRWNPFKYTATGRVTR